MKGALLVVCAAFTSVCAMGCAAETPIYPTPPGPIRGVPTSLELAVTAMTGANAGQAAIAARVLDAFSNPVSGASVSFETTSGNVNPSSVVSDRDGRGSAILSAAPGSVKV